MKLNWNFQRGGGSYQKTLPWGRYGYFLELHNNNNNKKNNKNKNNNNNNNNNDNNNNNLDSSHVIRMMLNVFLFRSWRMLCL